MLIAVLAAASACTRGRAEQAGPPPLGGTVDASAIAATQGATPPPVTESTMATVATTTTTAPPTTAAPSTRAAAPPTTPTTNPPFGEALAPLTPAGPLPTTIDLEGGRGGLPCPAGQRPVSATWFIGNATSGSGRLAFDSGPATPVPDSGRDERCVTPATHSYTYSATGPGGPASRSITV